MSNVEAIGAYLSTLRESRGMSPLEVVKAIWGIAPEFSKVNPNYIWRIETGQIKSPGAQLLMAFTKVVSGDPDDISQLLLNTNATTEDGRILAQTFLTQDDRDQIEALVREYGADRVQKALERMDSR